jgi:hypothetical protein
MSGLQLKAAKPVAPRKRFVAIPNIAGDGRRNCGNIHLHKTDIFAGRNYFTHSARHIPAATEAIQQLINGIAGRFIRLADKTNAFVRNDESPSLLVRRLLSGRAKGLNRHIANRYGERLIPTLGFETSW